MGKTVNDNRDRLLLCLAALAVLAFAVVADYLSFTFGGHDFGEYVPYCLGGTIAAASAALWAGVGVFIVYRATSLKEEAEFMKCRILSCVRKCAPGQIELYEDLSVWQIPEMVASWQRRREHPEDPWNPSYMAMQVGTPFIKAIDKMVRQKRQMGALFVTGFSAHVAATIALSIGLVLVGPLVGQRLSVAVALPVLPVMGFCLVAFDCWRLARIAFGPSFADWVPKSDRNDNSTGAFQNQQD